MEEEKGKAEEKQVMSDSELILTCSLTEGEEEAFLGLNKSNKVENEVLKSTHITELSIFFQT